MRLLKLSLFIWGWERRVWGYPGDKESSLVRAHRLCCDVVSFRAGSEDGRIGSEEEAVLPGPLYPEKPFLVGSSMFDGGSRVSWGETYLDVPGARAPSPQTHLYRGWLMPPTKKTLILLMPPFTWSHISRNQLIITQKALRK